MSIGAESGFLSEERASPTSALQPSNEKKYKKKELLTRIAGRLEQQQGQLAQLEREAGTRNVIQRVRVLAPPPQFGWDAMDGTATDMQLLYRNIIFPNNDNQRQQQAQVTALQLILLSRSALQQFLLRGECASAVLAALNEQARMLAAACSPMSCGEELGSAAHASSGVQGSDRSATTALGAHLQRAGPTQAQGHQQPPTAAAAAGSRTAIGAVGVPASSFLQSMAQARLDCGTRDKFVEAWQAGVLRLAMLTHQYRNGAASRESVEEVLRSMGVRLCGCLLSQPWAVQLCLVDLETGAEAAPAEGWWERVVRCMAISSETVRGVCARVGPRWFGCPHEPTHAHACKPAAAWCASVLLCCMQHAQTHLAGAGLTNPFPLPFPPHVTCTRRQQ